MKRDLCFDLSNNQNADKNGIPGLTAPAGGNGNGAQAKQPVAAR